MVLGPRVVGSLHYSNNNGFSQIHFTSLHRGNYVQSYAYCNAAPTETTTDLRAELQHGTTDNSLQNAGSSDASAVSISVDSNILPDKLYKTIDLELLGYESSVLDSYEWFILTAASHLGIEVGGVYTPRKSDKFRFPLLKSAHVHKKHRVHYEVRTYHKFITLKKLTGSTASTYLEYIQRNIPEGIGMKVSKLEVLPKPDYITDNLKSS